MQFCTLKEVYDICIREKHYQRKNVVWLSQKLKILCPRMAGLKDAFLSVQSALSKPCSWKISTVLALKIFICKLFCTLSKFDRRPLYVTVCNCWSFHVQMFRWSVYPWRLVTFWSPSTWTRPLSATNNSFLAPSRY